MIIKKYFIILVYLIFSSLSNASELRILTNVEPPTNYYSKEGIFTGITTDVVLEIKKQLNLNTNIEVVPWARAYKIAKRESNIVIFTAGKTQDRIDLGFHFIGPIITREHILWSKRGNHFNIKNLEDIKNKKLKIGAMRGDWRSKFFKDRGFDVQDVARHEQNIKKLIYGRFDLWATSDIEAPSIAYNAGFTSDMIEKAYVFRKSGSYIMLSKNSSKQTIKEWRDAYKKIQETDFFDKMAKKWSHILNFEFRYTTEKGLFVK